MENIKRILRASTLKQSLIVFSGSIVNGALGAMFYISLAKFLGPADFGLFIVSIAFLTLVADIVDFGTNTGLVRFVSGQVAINEEKALRFLKISLEIKLIAWGLVLLIGYLLVPFVAKEIFQKEILITPLRLSLIGVGGALLFSFATSALQAFQKFSTWSILNISSNFLRLGLIFILFFSQQLNLLSGLVTYITLPFLGFFLALALLPTKKFLTVSGQNEVSKELFNYNKWVALSTIFAAVSSRLDTFLTARLLTANELGIYGAANQLTAIMPQLVGALGTVVAPKFASFTSLEGMLSYFKKIQLMIIIIVTLGLTIIPISFFVLPLLFGKGYEAMVLPFGILFLAMLVFLLALPMQSSIYYFFGKPKFFAYLSFIQLLFLGFLGNILISKYGIIGAAFTVLLGMIFSLIFSWIGFLKFIKR